MDLELSGRHVLITVGSKGIGLAVAKGFAAEGCTLSLVSRNHEKLDRRLRLRSDCHHQKTTQPGHQFVYNITDFKRDHFRKYNPESTAYG